MRFKRILIAVDESSIAAHAAGVGIELAKALSAEIAFFFAIDPSTLAVPDSGIPTDVLTASAEQDARGLIDAFRQRADATPPALGFIEIGKPAKKVVEAARNWSADLVVVGSHGRGRVENMLLGSVAGGILRDAPCPVLVIRAQT